MFKPSPRYALLLLPALLLGLGISCAKLTPRTTALRQIHQLYRGEFDQYLQLPPSNREVSAKRGSDEKVSPAPFAATLREIRSYRIKFGEDNRESAHLTVLEGMIYLQTRQLKMARLLLPDIQQAAANLGQGSGAAVRDRLLAQNFESLLAGWGAIDEKRSAIDKARIFAKAADSIGANLASLDRLEPARTSEPEVDEGSIYLAATAAIFYLHAGENAGYRSPGDDPCWCAKGMSLIAPRLSESERRLARSVDNQSISVGRIRYLRIYSSLILCAGQRPVDNCHERLR